MTKQLKFYKDRDEYKQDKTMSNFSALHQDFIDGKLRITWVNGNDNPDNNPRLARQLSQNQFIDELAEGQGVSIVGRIVSALRSAFRV